MTHSRVQTESDVCSGPSESAAVYVERFKNLTNYYVLSTVGNESAELVSKKEAWAKERYRGNYSEGSLVTPHTFMLHHFVRNTK